MTEEERRRVGFLHCYNDVTANYTATWVVSGFDKLDTTDDYTLWSPPFDVVNGYSIELLIQFRITQNKFLKVVEFCAGVRCDDQKSFRTQFVVAIRNSEFRTVMEVEPERISTEGTGEKIVYTTPYLDMDTVMEILPDGTLEVFLEAKLSQWSVNSPFSIPSNLTGPVRTTSGQTSSLFESGTYSDMVISVQGEEIPTHRAVLAARSKVFAAMFEHEYKEGQTRRVEITDFDVGVVRTMLQFMYCGGVHQLSMPLAYDLLRISDKYDVNDLKNYCGEFLSSQLEPGNVVQVILVAHLHNADELWTRALEFFRENRSFVHIDSHRAVLEENPSVLFELFKRSDF